MNMKLSLELRLTSSSDYVKCIGCSVVGWWLLYCFPSKNDPHSLNDDLNCMYAPNDVQTPNCYVRCVNNCRTFPYMPLLYAYR